MRTDCIGDKSIMTPPSQTFYSLIESAKLNRLNPQHYLAEVLCMGVNQLGTPNIAMIAAACGFDAVYI
ncbi:MAG: transposase domain-containing protein, partial [Stellaceae bacterium]